MAVGSLIGAVIGANASQNAADTAAAASDRAAGLTAAAGERMRADLAPFRDVGVSATNRLAQLFGLAPQQPIMAQQQAQPSTAPVGMQGGYTYVPPGMADNGENGPTQTSGMLYGPNGEVVAVNPDPGTLAQYMEGGQQQAPMVTPAQVPSATMPAGEFGPFQAQTEFRMTPEALAATPGHQFAMAEGMKTINNSLGARGGMFSGRALKEGLRFSTGLADNTLRTQAGIFADNYGRAQNKFTTNLNPLMQLMQSGQNAAAQTGAGGLSAAQAGGNAIAQGGALSAAGQINAGNALMTGVNSGVNNALYAWGRGWLGGGGGGSGQAGAVNGAMNQYAWVPY